MKRIIIITILTSALSAANLFAQVGFSAGYLRTSLQNDAHKQEPLNGFYAGLSYNFKVASIFSINPGLRYSFGSRSDGKMEFKSISTKKSTQEHFIEMPVSLTFTIPVSKSVSVVAYGRPTFSYGISGEFSYEFSRRSQNDELLSFKYDYFKGKATAKNLPDELMNMINENIDKDSYRRYDVLLGAGAGIVLANLCMIHAGYDWGLLNRYKDKDNGSIKRNVLHVGVTFLF